MICAGKVPSVGPWLKEKGTHPLIAPTPRHLHLRRPGRHQRPIIPNLQWSRRTRSRTVPRGTRLAVSRITDGAEIARATTMPISSDPWRKARKTRVGTPLVAGGRDGRAQEVVGLGLERRLIAVCGSRARLRVLQVLGVAVGVVFGAFGGLGGDLGGDQGGRRAVLFPLFGVVDVAGFERIVGAEAVVALGVIVLGGAVVEVRA